MRRVRIGDVLKLVREPVEIEPFAEYESIGVRGFGRGLFRYQPKLGKDLGSLRFFRTAPGVLVISNIKAWEGAIALSNGDHATTLASNRFLQYGSDPDEVDLSYMRYFLLSESGLPLIQRASPGSAGRNRTLGIARFEAIEIPLPNIDEQRHIASRLEKVGAQVERATALMNRARTLDDAVAVSLAGRPDLSVAQKQRAGWIQCALGEVMSVKSAAEPVLVHETYPMAGVYSFGRGVIDRGELGGADTSYKTMNRLATDDVVISKLGAWEGAVAVVPPSFSGRFVSSEFPVFEIDSTQLVPSYFAGVSRSPDFWARMNGGTKGSMARRKRITPTRFLEIGVFLPPIGYQRDVAASLRSLDGLSARRVESAERLASIAPAALNEAFSSIT